MELPVTPRPPPTGRPARGEGPAEPGSPRVRPQHGHDSGRDAHRRAPHPPRAVSRDWSSCKSRPEGPRWREQRAARSRGVFGVTTKAGPRTRGRGQGPAATGHTKSPCHVLYDCSVREALTKEGPRPVFENLFLPTVL